MVVETRKWANSEEEGITFEIVIFNSDSALEKEAADILIKKLELNVSNFYDYDGIVGNDGFIANRTL